MEKVQTIETYSFVLKRVEKNDLERSTQHNGFIDRKN